GRGEEGDGGCGREVHLADYLLNEARHLLRRVGVDDQNFRHFLFMLVVRLNTTCIVDDGLRIVRVMTMRKDAVQIFLQFPATAVYLHFIWELCARWDVISIFIVLCTWVIATALSSSIAIET